MSDYELVSFFVANVEGLQTSMMNYVAVLFAFLIAAYLIADKLESSMVAVAIGLFTLVTLQQASPIIGFGHDAAALAVQIATRAAEDPSSVGWHGAATPLGSTGTPILRFSTIVVLVLSYIGALIFFFHQRHLGSKHPENGNSKDG
jgi:hypothetical protein